MATWFCGDWRGSYVIVTLYCARDAVNYQYTYEADKNKLLKI
jgi:hypothetical protein